MEKAQTINDQEYFAFYGSLRKGEGNWRYFLAGKDGVEFVQTCTIPGFDLYSLGAYPVILPSENENQPLIVDLFKITNNAVKRGIDGMEIGAGYKRQMVDVAVAPEFEGPDTVYQTLIYVGGEYYGHMGKDRLVPDGDWSKRKTQNKTNAAV